MGYDAIEYDVPLKERDASHGDTSVCTMEGKILLLSFLALLVLSSRINYDMCDDSFANASSALFIFNSTFAPPCISAPISVHARALHIGIPPSIRQKERGSSPMLHRACILTNDNGVKTATTIASEG